MMPERWVAEAWCTRGRVQIDTARGLDRWQASNSTWYARQPRVPVACVPSVEQGPPFRLIRARQAYASPLGFMGTTRQLTACVNKIRTSPVVTVVTWTVVVTWLLFIEVPNYEETGCRN